MGGRNNQLRLTLLMLTLTPIDCFPENAARAAAPSTNPTAPRIGAPTSQRTHAEITRRGDQLASALMNLWQCEGNIRIAGFGAELATSGGDDHVLLTTYGVGAWTRIAGRWQRRLP